MAHRRSLLRTFNLLSKYPFGGGTSPSSTSEPWLLLQRSIISPSTLSSSSWSNLFSTNKKEEEHINDAKARPVEQGYRLDNTSNSSSSSTSDTVTSNSAELEASVAKLTAENVKLSEKVKEFEDKYMRALAETENVRNRLTKQISDGKLFAIQGFCKDLTEIEDILRLAIDSVPPEEISKEGKHLKGLYEGLKMTEGSLLKVFQRHGLKQLNPLGEKFNPNEHEAVVQQAVEGKDEGTVIFVSKVGYKLHDRVIRPAVVGVAK